ncbi:hypothetical protein ABPG75_013526 [Micractinium tetrahymenae]
MSAPLGQLLDSLESSLGLGASGHGSKEALVGAVAGRTTTDVHRQQLTRWLRQRDARFAALAGQLAAAAAAEGGDVEAAALQLTALVHLHTLAAGSTKPLPGLAAVLKACAPVLSALQRSAGGACGSTGGASAAQTAAAHKLCPAMLRGLALVEIQPAAAGGIYPRSTLAGRLGLDSVLALLEGALLARDDWFAGDLTKPATRLLRDALTAAALAAGGQARWCRQPGGEQAAQAWYDSAMGVGSFLNQLPRLAKSLATQQAGPAVLAADLALLRLELAVLADQRPAAERPSAGAAAVEPAARQQQEQLTALVPALDTATRSLLWLGHSRRLRHLAASAGTFADAVAAASEEGEGELSTEARQAPEASAGAGQAVLADAVDREAAEFVLASLLPALASGHATWAAHLFELAFGSPGGSMPMLRLQQWAAFMLDSGAACVLHTLTDGLVKMSTDLHADCVSTTSWRMASSCLTSAQGLLRLDWVLTLVQQRGPVLRCACHPGGIDMPALQLASRVWAAQCFGLARQCLCEMLSAAGADTAGPAVPEAGGSVPRHGSSEQAGAAVGTAVGSGSSEKEAADAQVALLRASTTLSKRAHAAAAAPIAAAAPYATMEAIGGGLQACLEAAQLWAGHLSSSQGSWRIHAAC